MATELEDRLARMGEAVAPDDTATARARDAALTALPAPRRGRRWRRALPRRRVLSAAFAVAGTVAIAAVLVLSLPRGDDRPVPAGITLVATAPVPGATVDAAALETTARMIDRRAEIMRVDGADAEVVDDGIVLHLPADAPPGTLRDLTARGEFAMYDALKVTIGPPGGTLARPVTAPGQRVVVEPVGGIPPVKDSARHILIRDEPALTNADVASVSADAVEDGEVPLLSMHLTSEGRRAAHALSRSVSQEGAIRTGLASIMVVLDGELVSNPTVDPGDFPDGIDSDMFQIDAGPGIPDSWRRATAAKIEEGPLPVVLTPAG